MGNSSSSQETKSILLRRARETHNNPVYKLVDQQGGGELSQWMKYSITSGDYNILDGLLEVKVERFLYGGGKGKLTPISELVKARNKERNAMLGALQRKKGKGKSGPNILEQINQEEMQGDMMKALKMLDGGGKSGKGGLKYRELCWDINKRGAMGETVLHACLLQGTTLHNELAKRLLYYYPKLINDIFLSEDYYGNSPLHQAIVNEDPEMVRFLLQHGADVNQRCYGAFFCPDDQRASRHDSLEHEWVDVSQRTNYSGHMYWGEYPLAFAACSRQPDCFRLLRAKKADPNMKDTNGNTVLHLMVIHEMPDMFDLAHRLGAKLHMTNNQNLTPLTLAARLAKKQVFEHVLMKERDVLWTYGDVICAAYPLQYIDTIDQMTGELNPISALGLVIYGESRAHLDLLDGLMEDLLQEKWKAFAYKKLIHNFLGFFIYFVVFFTAFIFRYYSSENRPDDLRSLLNQLPNATIPVSYNQSSGIYSEMIWEMDNNMTLLNFMMNETEPESCNSYYCEKRCHLMYSLCYLSTPQQCWPLGPNWRDRVRLTAELATVVGVVTYLVAAVRQARRIGWKEYKRTLMAFPAKLMFNISFLFVLLMIPLRFACWDYLEHIVGVFAMLTCSVHLLFFCRGLKFIGPFVLMVYKIIKGDMLRFFVIYLIFVMGFSQAFIVIFKGCDRCYDKDGTQCVPDHNHTVNVTYPLEPLARMFIMSIGEFSVFYKDLHHCNLAYLGKVMFIVFELCVSIMLLNLLIAMMARTYQEIVETQKEWKRQWAKVILLLERALQPKERLLALLKYSRPIGTDKHKRAFVVKYAKDKHDLQTDEVRQKEAVKQFKEEKRALLKKKQQREDADGLNSRCQSRIGTIFSPHLVHQHQ